MPFRLRDYQFRDINKIMTRLAPGRRVMYQLPTGGGKTAVATEVARRWLVASRERRAAWLTHRRELESQSAETLERAGIASAKARVISPLRLINAARRGDIKPRKTDLLIVDEAHHSTARTWETCIHRWPGPVLGLSATPWRLSKRQGFDHIFESIIHGPKKSELIKRGYLTPSLVKRPPDASRVIRGYGSDGRGDYSVAETARRQSSTLLVELGVKWLTEWERVYRKRFKTLIYCVNVEHARAVAEYATRSGVSTRSLFADTPKAEREQTIERFRNGQIDALANVAILTEGFDAPDTDCVLCLRPTQSLALWLQMVGRANRLSEGKTYGLILDGTTNTERLGHPDSDFQWSLAPRATDSEKGGGQSPTRRCPNPDCQTISASGSRRCPECHATFGVDCAVCGWVFGTQGEDVFELPRLDSFGRCDRCSLIAQENRFGRGIPEADEFERLFSPNRKGNLTYSDRNTNVSYWVTPGYDDKRGVSNSRGGAYMEDPSLARFLPKGITPRGGGTGNQPLAFQGETAFVRRRVSDVMRFLYENVYYPTMMGITVADPVRNGLKTNNEREAQNT